MEDIAGAETPGSIGSRVFVGYPTAGNPKNGFVVSFVRLLRFWPDAAWAYAGGSRLLVNRNQLMRHFLNTGRDWMLQIDDDMIFEPEWVERMILRAEEVGVKVISGLAFGDDHGQMFSTLMIRHPQQKDGYLRAANWPADGLVEAQATGGAMLAIHRDVALKMEKSFAKRAPYNWFDERVKGGRSYGEDVVFAERARSLGFKVFVDCGNKTGHVKETVWTEAGYMRNLRDKAMILGPYANFVAMVMGLMNINARQSHIETHERWRIVVPRMDEEFEESQWRSALLFDTSTWTDETDVVRWIMEKLRDLGIVRPTERVLEAIQQAGGVPALPSAGIKLDLEGLE